MEIFSGMKKGTLHLGGEFLWDYDGTGYRVLE